jgi:hypothetical protein
VSNAGTPPLAPASTELSQAFRTSSFGARFGLKVDPALRPAVGDEQLSMVLGHTRLGTLVATAFAVFMALQLRGNPVPPWLVDGWLVAKLGVAAARIYLSLRYDKLGRPGGARWIRITDGWLLADGILWGIAGFLLMSSPIPLASPRSGCNSASDPPPRMSCRCWPCRPWACSCAATNSARSAAPA